ncbi:hypothetical protein THAOC_32722, partial [Thalassiosira oceanica]
HLTLPLSVIKLGSDAFERCVNMIKVQLSVGLQVNGLGEFRDFTALQQVTIPASVSELGCYAFQGCINLAEVHFIEGSLQVIGESAFRDWLHGIEKRGYTRKRNQFGQACIQELRKLDGSDTIGGERLLNQKFLNRGLLSGKGALNKRDSTI